LRSTLVDHGWTVDHIAGLTFPLSNLLLRVSNGLVRRYEDERLALDPGERTIASGRRHVPWKTSFPSIARAVLNPVALYPFHVLQKASRRSSRALVLYCEARPATRGPARSSMP
jgi:hypothetical protein